MSEQPSSPPSTMQFFRAEDIATGKPGPPFAVVEYDAERLVMADDEIEIAGHGEYRVVRRRWSFAGRERHLVLIVEHLT